MTELILARVKVIQLLLFALVIALLFLGGCGEGEPDESTGVENMAVSLSGGVDINTMGTGEWKGSQNPDGTGDAGEAGDLSGTGSSGVMGSMEGTDTPDSTGNGTEPKMALNPDETTVVYGEMDFMSSCRTIGGDSIYSTGYRGEFDGSHPAEGSYFAGRIGMGEDAVQQFPLDIPENMFAYRGCTDSQGRWHLLLAQKNGNTIEADKRTEIWVINREGELEQSFDITECVKEGGWFSLWMAAGDDGVYYLAANGNIGVIDAVNQTVKTLHFSGQINGIGIGGSGALYGVFDVQGDEMLGIIDTDSGSIQKCAELPENSVRPTFSVLQPGVSTELLLANKGDGIWSYDGTDLKQELTLESIVTNGQDILAMGFLWDGRVCIMSYENGKYVFHYVPIEV